jgi:hypothetical protein
MQSFLILISIFSTSAFAANEPWSTVPTNSQCPYVLEGVYDSYIRGGGNGWSRTVIYAEDGILKALHFMRVAGAQSRGGLGYIDNINVDQNCLMTGNWHDRAGVGTIIFQFRTEENQVSFYGGWNTMYPNGSWNGHRQQTAVTVPTPTPTPMP